jgi:hypothetical protein
MFKIVKKTSGWWHIYNGGSKEVSISNFEAVLDNVAQTFIIQNLNGANVPKIAVSITDIIVIDETDASIEETFADVEALKVRLTALGYTPYLGAGNADSITGLIEAGTNVTVTGSGTLADPYVINSSGGGSTPNLQQVTDEGNTITDGTDTMYVNPNGIEIQGVVNQMQILNDQLIFSDGTNDSSYSLEVINNNGVSYPLPTGASSQIATLADITGGSGGYTVVSSNLTAVNDTNYTVVANATFTDPSPTEGKGFVVYVRNGTATIGGTGYGVGSLVFRVFHSGGWSSREYKSNLTASDIPTGIDATKLADGSVSNTEFQRLDGVTGNIQTQIDSKQDELTVFKNTTQTTVTSTTGETIVYVEEVLGNSISNNTILSFTSRNYRNPRVGTCIYKLYINTVNNLSGSPVQIARLDATVNIGSNPLERQFLIKDNVIYGFQFNVSAHTDNSGGNVNLSSTSYNINTTYYWILTAQPNTSTDVMVHNLSILQKK